jgi:excisionase family DNA binding protein
MTEKMLFSKYEALQLLGVGLGRFDKSIRDGELLVRRVGRRVLIPRESLEAFSRADEAENVGAKECR